MTDPRPTLLLTRPFAAGQEFTETFKARFGADWPTLLSPLMETQPLSPELPQRPFAHIAFTSQAAVPVFARLTADRTQTAWCVGQRTALAAKAAGFAIRQGAGDAHALARIIRTERPAGAILWPHGAQTAHDLAADLSAAGFDVTALLVYAQQPLAPTPAAQMLLAGGAPVLLPLFSPRSARLAVTAFGAHAAPLRVAALSPAVANAAAGLAPERLSIARTPDSESLLAALAALI
ncbi:MAG TPA: uroporphyrinogen-III synthase [Paracoccaceae bacterium]|nr:uroporphyrinogen-III synthase [Paracoccaceae bacterium]